MMDKPVQIAVCLARTENEQFGQQALIVLTESGRIYERWEAPWKEVTGPWMETLPLEPEPQGEAQRHHKWPTVSTMQEAREKVSDAQPPKRRMAANPFNMRG